LTTRQRQVREGEIVFHGVETAAEPSKALLKAAVHRHGWFSRKGLGERAFTLAFGGLVYPQIWEDPRVDLEALEIRPESRIVAIASGGCNVMSYLTADPASILAVDLNATHVALNRLKLAAAACLPDYEAFYAFFGTADSSDNVDNYELFIAPYLEPTARRYWEGRTVTGRRRIERFARNFYRSGLLGWCIGAGHVVARLMGSNPSRLLAATSLNEQHRLFEEELAPLFDRALVRWLMDRPSALYGLGIPPMQYAALSGGRPMSEVACERLRRLACDFPIAESYFAQQAFGRRYLGASPAGLPPYLTPSGYRALRERGGRVTLKLATLTAALAESPAASFDRYVLLDAQDWMTDTDLTQLWGEITRTARPEARVIFRTAAAPTLLPGRVPTAVLDRWAYQAERSAEVGARDRSAIYGGFHLYVLRG
jgi:S-adenosylmethionine-diacylglycerol 3-amino-3-carboxypropyl transferase